MKLYTFNVNGIRAALKKGLLEWVKSENMDILCLQEIKLSETELVEHLFTDLGYFCYWYPAQKRGYSGVAILTKIKPESVTFGIGVEPFDQEGRVIQANFKSFTLVCAYFPSGTTGNIRQNVKMAFLEQIDSFLSSLAKEKHNVVLCGDVNICHTEIDIHNPKVNKKTSGFLPEERAWVEQFIKQGYIDTFRFFNKEPHHYSWWSYRAGARPKNLGWRIDYFFTSAEMKKLLTNSEIHADIVMSDHCPVSLSLDI